LSLVRKNATENFSKFFLSKPGLSIIPACCFPIQRLGLGVAAAMLLLIAIAVLEAGACPLQSCLPHRQPPPCAARVRATAVDSAEDQDSGSSPVHTLPPTLTSHPRQRQPFTLCSSTDARAPRGSDPTPSLPQHPFVVAVNPRPASPPPLP
jgi:hypothetical protein